MKHIILALLIFSAACVTSEPPLPAASSQYKTVQNVNPLVCENYVEIITCVVNACEGHTGYCSVFSHGESFADTDCDGVIDQTSYSDQGPNDNCTQSCNPDQTNSDTDAYGDSCDPCPFDPGNDIDADGVCGEVDNCPAHHNTQQSDADTDGFGDVCDQI